MEKTVSGKESANFVLFTPDPGKVMDRLLKDVTYIEAGGGLVINEKGQYLFIFRNGKWDLPKGKLEKGEGADAGSIREVEEECNITVKRIK
ncbi:MAG TPA: NUDIX domain-containing protein, partial [Anseongella sp.]|nr:NUDIX domain-containing protein [Anseongella sp.]